LRNQGTARGQTALRQNSEPKPTPGSIPRICHFHIDFLCASSKNADIPEAEGKKTDRARIAVDRRQSIPENASGEGGTILKSSPVLAV